MVNGINLSSHDGFGTQVLREIAEDPLDLCPFFELIFNQRLDLVFYSSLILSSLELHLYYLIINAKEVILPIYVLNLVFQALHYISDLLIEVPIL
jgi:hypothetical protein